jgi:hypothetical protein
MKLTVIIFLILMIFGKPVIAQEPAQTAYTLLGVFDGRTPCNVLAAYLNAPSGPDCIKIKWRLSLFVDSISHKPGRYELIGITYKRENPRMGTWQILNGTHEDPQAIVYQLNETGRPPLFFQKCGNNVLFFLDEERKLLVGNRDFSYTLNRNFEKY